MTQRLNTCCVVCPQPTPDLFETQRTLLQERFTQLRNNVAVCQSFAQAYDQELRRTQMWSRTSAFLLTTGRCVHRGRRTVPESQFSHSSTLLW